MPFPSFFNVSLYTSVATTSGVFCASITVKYDFALAVLFVDASSIIIFVDTCILPLTNSFII